MNRPTLRDVAAQAGLSVTQVSRALNDHDDVAHSTKELARRVAAELRYTPNLEARRLKNPRTRTGVIGIILASDSLRFSDPFFGELMSAMVAAAADAGRQLSLSTQPVNTSETESYELAIRRNQVDGFVLLRTRTDDPRVSFLLDADVPFVTLGSPNGQRSFGSVEVSSDCFAPLVAHLHELGHRRVACLTEPSRFAMGAARLAAFLHSAHEHDLHVSNDDIIEAGFHEGSGHEAARALLNRSARERPTAIVAMNDLLALGALDAAADLDIKVPDEVSIVGFDDIPAARQVRPALTTVRQDAHEVGRALIETLVPAIEVGRSTHVQHRIGTRLEIRHSSARAPGSLLDNPSDQAAGA